MSSRAAFFTDVVAFHPEINAVDVRFGDDSSFYRSGTVRVTLPTLSETETRYAKAIAELEVLKTVITNPWRLRPDYHKHQRQPTIGIPWSLRSLSLIQVSQGATRKALLSATGSQAKKHPITFYATWGVFWLEGAQVQVQKNLSAFQEERISSGLQKNHYSLTASMFRENIVNSPSLGLVEVSQHALQQFINRSGFGDPKEALHFPPQKNMPGSCALTLSRWLLRENMVRLELESDISAQKLRRHGSEASHWGVFGEVYRFTIIPLSNNTKRLTTVYTREIPVGHDETFTSSL